MADELDIDAVDPMMELTFRPSSLVCTGTLNTRTRRYVLEAASVLMAEHPPRVTIDISNVDISDVDGANTLAHLQRIARQAGTVLHWEGLESDRLRAILPLRVPAKGSRPSPPRLRVYERPSPAAQQLPTA